MDPVLSVVIPFRDEEGSLRTLHAELTRVLDRLPWASELIFVDDASRDGGRLVVRDLAARDERVRLLALSPQRGQSAALEAGFRAARGRIVATLDADLQNDPADLPRLLAALDQADCVCGVRSDRQDRLAKRLASKLANAIRRRVLSDGVTDIGCSLRVMRAPLLRRVKLFRGGHRFLPSLLAMEGARIVELPVRHRPRRHGSSKYGVARRLRVVWIDLLAVAWLKRRIDRYEVKELSRRV
ncbi:MAG TPA: glycosyltransferase [Deltaproteobacteria bacterium]|nr:glycosyltransferase [Deltaproteobacteria bacterium]